MYGITFNYAAAAAHSLIDDEYGAARLDFMTRYLYVYLPDIFRIYKYSRRYLYIRGNAVSRDSVSVPLYCSEIWLVGDTYDLVAFRLICSNTVLRIGLTRNAVVLLSIIQ